TVGPDRWEWHSRLITNRWQRLWLPINLHNTLFDTSKVPSTSSSVVKLPFYNCEIFVVSDKRVKPYGSITAHHIKKADENTGYVFIRGKVYGIDDVYLGRAKGPYSRCPGPGADRQRRSDWAKELTKQEVEFFLSIDFIDGTYWLPVLLQQTFSRLAFGVSRFGVAWGKNIRRMSFFLQQ
ncbi:hypothetical protein HID58_043897, partial [Brassica napus]